jgi:hypothetical protein
MNDENRLIIKQLNKFGRIPETSELLKMIEDLEKERTMYKTSFEVMSKNYFELQNDWNGFKNWLEEQWKQSQDIWFVKVIGKMQEMGQGKDENN